jgi:hypothetical protein
MKKLFLKPGIGIDGKMFVIPVPGKNRDVSADGEELSITPYFEKRIAKKELIVSSAKTTKKGADK